MNGPGVVEYSHHGLIKRMSGEILTGDPEFITVDSDDRTALIPRAHVHLIELFKETPND